MFYPMLHGRGPQKWGMEHLLRGAGTLAIFVLAISFAPARGTIPAQSQPPSEYRILAREILAELISINTTQSRGATPAVRAIAARLRAAGFAEDDLVMAGPRPEKLNLVVRLRGRGAGRPILFLAHLDVVEARAEDWTVDPWTLTERDGWFYGRGVLDIKVEVSDLVTNLIRLKKEKFLPARDIIVALTDDEEGGDANGAAWLNANRRELVDVEYVINADAAGGQIQNDRRVRIPIQTSEKGYVTWQLEVTNPGGHSALPKKDNAIYRLADALTRLARYDFPVRLNETTRAWFHSMAEREEGQLGEDLMAVTRTPPDDAAVRRLSSTPVYNSTMRTTCVATMIEGGHADNALPQRARATIQCRFLPDDDPAAVQTILAQVIADTGVSITMVDQAYLGTASPVRPGLFRAIERITDEMWPGVQVLPVMDPWFTDGHYFRVAGVPVYGLSGIFYDMYDNRSHGKDERVGVQEFYEGIEFMYRVMRSLADK
jgi:acetylornithine deacetylase/succinyl-diaminopimelate desuccinylase-like protein